MSKITFNETGVQNPHEYRDKVGKTGNPGPGTFDPKTGKNIYASDGCTVDWFTLHPEDRPRTASTRSEVAPVAQMEVEPLPVAQEVAPIPPVVNSGLPMADANPTLRA
jgi:hypothetical protein